MLTTTGHGLLPDPALPHRDVLLDPDTVAGLLAAELGTDGPLPVTSCTPVRCKYRLGESLRTVHRLRVGATEHLVSARMFVAGAAPTVTAPAGAGPLRPVLRADGLDTVFWTFPHDRRLRGIDALLAPPPDLARLVPGAWRGTEVAQYAPERSVTVRAHDGAEHTVGYAKAYAPGTVDLPVLAARYRRIAAELARQDLPVEVPTTLGMSPARGVLTLAAMPGVSWLRLPADRLGAAMQLLGTGIALLHGLPLGTAPGLRTFGRLAPPRLLRSLELIAAARPDHAAAAGRLAAALACGPPESGPPVLLHGDCHPGNALFDGDRLALIDLDQAGAGPAAADLGSLLARLHHGAVLGEHTPAECADLGAAALTGYAAVRPLPGAAALAWHTAAALVAERALRAVNRVHAPAIAQLGPLLEAAETILHEGAPR